MPPGPRRDRQRFARVRVVAGVLHAGGLWVHPNCFDLMSSTLGCHGSEALNVHRLAQIIDATFRDTDVVSLDSTNYDLYRVVANIGAGSASQRCKNIRSSGSTSPLG